VRVGLLFVLLLGASWASEARQLENARISKISLTQINYQEQDSEVQTLKDDSGNEKLCTLCEEFAGEALDYLAENKTQAEIIEILHVSCASMGFFTKECITLVDYYAPLFFLEVSNIQAEEFCRKISLCQEIARFSSQLHEDSCGLCHRVFSEVLAKLKDPDTQLEVIELLLKACNSMDNYAKKCKRIVFEYGPVILINAEKFLETTDVCVTLHACNSSTTANKEAAMLSDS